MKLDDYGDEVIKQVANFIKKKLYVFWSMQVEDYLKTAGFEDYDECLDAQLQDFYYLSDEAKEQIKTVIKMRVKEINQDPLHPIRLYDKMQQNN